MEATEEIVPQSKRCGGDGPKSPHRNFVVNFGQTVK